MKNIDTFQFKIAGSDSHPAIWMWLQADEVRVSPHRLYEILWDGFEDRWITPQIMARFQILSHHVNVYFLDDDRGTYTITYRREDFVTSAFRALRAWCHAVLKGDPISYAEVHPAVAQQMLAGLEELAIPLEYDQIREGEIALKPFSFEGAKPCHREMPYTLKIGEQSYSDCFPLWGTAFNRIRTELEHYVYDLFQRTEIHLDNDTLPIRIRLHSALNHDLSAIVKVTVYPSEDENGVIVFGWCDPRQVIRSLYLGLLGLCLVEAGEFDEVEQAAWASYRLATYNQLQSCVLEQFILGIEVEQQCLLPRHRIVHSLEEMRADYHQLLRTLDAQ